MKSVRNTKNMQVTNAKTLKTESNIVMGCSVNQTTSNLVVPIYTPISGAQTLHISKGNSKIGKTIYAFSTLPGNEHNLLYVTGDRREKTLLTAVPGTCSKHCEGCFNSGCYAVRSAMVHHNQVVPAWTDNTLLLRSGQLFDKLHEYLSQKNAKYLKTHKKADRLVHYFRINVSGEIQNCAELEQWNSLAAKHPEIVFSVYTKNYEALGEFLDKHSDSQPNFVINVSQWHGVADQFLAKYRNQLNVFEYDDSNRKKHGLSETDVQRLAALPHCPAVLKNGRHAKTPAGQDITCDMCLRCYTKNGAHTCVYAH